MDFATVRFFRIVFAVSGVLVGAATGHRYVSAFPILGPVAGGILGAFIGWHAVDLIKGRAHK
jgi:uncharacterized membrane protein YfcA